MRLAILVLLTAALVGAASPDYDVYGGWLKLTGTKTGFFHAERIQGRWWLITPDGNAFFSKGVDNVNDQPESDAAPRPPADPAAWAARTSAQLRSWGFNTLGAWTVPRMFDQRLAYTVILDLSAAIDRDVWIKGGVVDYFSPEFRAAAGRVAGKLCAARAKDPWLLGYFTDNELRWGADWRSKQSVLEAYLKMPKASAGYREASKYMSADGQVSEEGKAKFLEAVAAHYGRVAREAIRANDPNHLILGCRFAVYPGDGVMRAVAPYFDVISYHSYTPQAPVETLEKIGQLTSKPVMITEFSFKAMDSGLPNTKGAAKPVLTQQERADGFAGYVETLASLPGCVGYHWFEYRDEPKEGRRLDGENSNYGLVKIDFSPWKVLTDRMQAVNAQLEVLHAKAPVR